MTTIAQPTSFVVSILPNAALINDTPLCASGPPADFHAIFGTPDRIADATTTPAPVGHRNNQFHYYDSHGITLNEHHYTGQIQAINFVFDLDFAHHPTKKVFNGTMHIGGLHIVPGLLERQLSDSEFTFIAQLPGTWFANTLSAPNNGFPISVAVSTDAPKLASGHRSKTKVVTSVSLGLQHDPWDTTHVPNTKLQNNAVNRSTHSRGN